ncbi:MAG: HEAT repeat domain-containing protein [Candidatus Latescibacteria bacterium]|nr:HEAT repeat domain-containing protein [Candidatus Latescibacterota bacterium]
MKCETIQANIPEYLSGTLDSETSQQVKMHISECTTCRQKVEAMNLVWSKLEQIPEEEPGFAVRSRFYHMLEAYKIGMNNAPAKKAVIERVNEWLAVWWPRKPVFQFGITVAVLILGILIGFRMNFGTGPKNEITQLKDEMSEMRQLVTLSLLTRPSAIDRLQGVAMSKDIINPDEKHLSALINTLNTDPNVNVRLAVVTALEQFSDTLWVRNELVQSLEHQQSPLVQIYLIDLLAKIREQNALETLKTIIDNPETMEPVKKRARLGMEKII